MQVWQVVRIFIEDLRFIRILATTAGSPRDWESAPCEFYFPHNCRCRSAKMMEVATPNNSEELLITLIFSVLANS
jgi:hypothetical protein